MTQSRTQASLLLVLMTGSVVLSGCVSNETKPSEPAPQTTAAPQAEAKPVATPAPVCKDDAVKSKSSQQKSKTKTTQDPACSKPAAATTRTQPPAITAGGYDLSRNKRVTDSSKVESGQGTQVKGINDWEGEITGLPVAGSRFTKLKIGMPMQQVIDLFGSPTDQGAYITGKAFIPFYFGSDKARWETTYKGQGRLIFSNQAGFGTGQYLTWIIYNENEPGYR